MLQLYIFVKIHYKVIIYEDINYYFDWAVTSHSGVHTHKNIISFALKLDGIWSCWEFFFWLWAKHNSIYFTIKRKTEPCPRERYATTRSNKSGQIFSLSQRMRNILKSMQKQFSRSFKVILFIHIFILCVWPCRFLLTWFRNVNKL